jgi:hypothetical protein
VTWASPKELRFDPVNPIVTRQASHPEKLGCEFGQGYFSSHPLDIERAEQLLQQEGRGRMSAHTRS